MTIQNMTREKMGTLALPKKRYACTPCRRVLTHDQCHQHWLVCPYRTGGRRG